MFLLSSSSLVLYAFKIAFNFACYPLIKKKRKKKVGIGRKSVDDATDDDETRAKELILKCAKRMAQSYTNRPLNARAIPPDALQLTLLLLAFLNSCFCQTRKNFQHRNF